MLNTNVINEKPSIVLVADEATGEFFCTVTGRTEEGGAWSETSFKLDGLDNPIGESLGDFLGNVSLATAIGLPGVSMLEENPHDIVVEPTVDESEAPSTHRCGGGASYDF